MTRSARASSQSLRALRALAPLSLLVAGGSLAAQDARVVSCNSSNGQILDIDFTGLTSTLLTSDSNRVSMQSCVLRDDGAAGVHLIVADRNGEVVLYENGTGPGQLILGIDPANPASPDGLSLDGRHDLYGVSSAAGGASTSAPLVWMLLRDPAGALVGGYAAPVATIDRSLPGIDLLTETVLVKTTQGALVAGDLLVLASDPPLVLRYRSAELATFRADLEAGLVPAELTPDVFLHPPGAAVPAARRFPLGATPNGMDLTQDGSLLISAGEGTILHYLADGTRKTDGAGSFVDFYTGLGNGQFKLATGLQDGALRLFLTDRNRGEVHRFGFVGDGTGILEATVADPQSPNGLATTTAAVQPTPAGSGVVVNSSSLMVSAIETVTVGGATGVTEFVFTDPRELEPGAPTDPSAPLHRALDLNGEISSDLPVGVEIPAHVRGFRRADPVTGLPTGDPTLIVLVASTSADFLGVIQHIADESLILGWDPDCADPDPSLRPKLFWRDNPDAGEPPIPEAELVNVTNGCGTSRGLTMHFSVFVPARDTRDPLDVAASQIAGLGLVLGESTCIRTKLLRELERSQATAARELGRGRPDRAAAALQELLTTLNDAPASSFTTCTENEAGAVEVRATSALYTLTTR